MGGSRRLVGPSESVGGLESARSQGGCTHRMCVKKVTMRKKYHCRNLKPGSWRSERACCACLNSSETITVCAPASRPFMSFMSAWRLDDVYGCVRADPVRTSLRDCSQATRTTHSPRQRPLRLRRDVRGSWAGGAEMMMSSTGTEAGRHGACGTHRGRYEPRL